MSNCIVWTLWSFLLTLLVLVSPGLAEVTGTIEQKDPKTLCLDIKITKPAPSTAIITMDVPTDVTVNKSEPNYSRVSKEKGQIQWLLKDIKPGTTKIVVSFDKDIDLQKLRVIIRYKDASGNTIESEIKKK